MRSVDVQIPGGMLLDGGWCRDAVLRPLTGDDELMLLEEGRRLPMAARVTTVLQRCVVRIGPLGAVTRDHIRHLSVGDREALLLHLRRLTLGDRMSCILTCPRAECGKKMDLDLNISELLLPPYPHASDLHAAPIGEGDDTYRVTFRVPNGADQEAAAALTADAPDSAADLLLRRCVRQVERADRGDAVSGIPEAVVAALPAKMAELDPQAEILLDLQCPECGHPFEAVLDAADYIWKELEAGQADLYREIHVLASNYHWSEADILSLTRRNRRRYLDLIFDSTPEGRPHE